MPIPHVDAYRAAAPAAALIARIREAWSGPPVRIMEVCGTHTMAIARHGLRAPLAGAVKLISGPGCPVCVTPDGYIDAAVALASRAKITLATFGDMVRVPGSRGSLEQARAAGADVRIVYSPLDAVDLAAAEPDREVVFLGVGFETTAPTVAGAIVTARQRNTRNFSVLSSLRTIPGAMALLAADPAVRIDAFLCPANVSAIIGADAYRPLAERYLLPCVVGGFEPLDILSSVLMILRQKSRGEARVENEYARVATPGGNRRAQALLAEVFEPCDADWRGLGVLPASGLRIAGGYADFDAGRKLGIAVAATPVRSGCRCGDVLKGMIDPPGCPLFGAACTPATPVGPCMVSTEGACAAAFKYGSLA
ncbi:MAG TPA: hydrogenase formation protein HypD [Candidatus Deferrimicrobiaceae bacterium]|jgi:hydrogenase expression/formation protein HypD